MVRSRWTRAALAGAAALALLLLWAWRGGDSVESYAARRASGAPVEGRELPLIFIGGVPRSGTTLMRAMLDAHPLVRCGQETRVVPRILQMRQHWVKSQKESIRLDQAGVSKTVLDNAIAAFCLEVIVRHGESAPRYCNKDPLMLKMGTYVLELFPNAKFIFMVRDGRATVHSIISRQVTITGFDLTSYRQCITKWNHAIELMYQQCKAMGPDKCLMDRGTGYGFPERADHTHVSYKIDFRFGSVAIANPSANDRTMEKGAVFVQVQYEKLVLRPQEQLRRVLGFLELPWHEAVLHHERYINRPHGVALSQVERSSDQVVRAVNLEALHKWVGKLPADVQADMAELAPMLSVLGYDPWANPPRYAEPEPPAPAALAGLAAFAA